MSRSVPIAEAERLARSLTVRLAIVRHLFLDCVLSARANRIEASGRPIDCTPIDGAIIAEGARLALAAAIELEAPLREIRDRMEVRR